MSTMYKFPSGPVVKLQGRNQGSVEARNSRSLLLGGARSAESWPVGEDNVPVHQVPRHITGKQIPSIFFKERVTRVESASRGSGKVAAGDLSVVHAQLIEAAPADLGPHFPPVLRRRQLENLGRGTAMVGDVLGGIHACKIVISLQIPPGNDDVGGRESYSV